MLLAARHPHGRLPLTPHQSTPCRDNNEAEHRPVHRGDGGVGGRRVCVSVFHRNLPYAILADDAQRASGQTRTHVDAGVARAYGFITERDLVECKWVRRALASPERRLLIRGELFIDYGHPQVIRDVCSVRNLQRPIRVDRYLTLKSVLHSDVVGVCVCYAALPASSAARRAEG
jgi:hypothetical protein